MIFEDETEQAIYGAFFAVRLNFYEAHLGKDRAATQAVCNAHEAVLAHRNAVEELGDDEDRIAPRGVRVVSDGWSRRRAAQVLIDEIGAPGPERIDETAERAAAYMRHMRSAALPEYLPEVALTVSGDTATDASEPGESPSWFILCERESETRAHVRVRVAGMDVAEVVVCRRAHSALEDEVQDVSAAILWSALRAWHLRAAKAAEATQ